MRLAPIALMLALSLTACGEDGDSRGDDPGAENGGTGGGGEGGQGGTGGTADAVTWAPCDDGSGECATVEVPLDWNAPDGDKLPFFVRRFATTEGESKGQLWLLQGGPGHAGWQLYDLLPWMRPLARGFDIYVPDYRGVGHSAWLGCEGQSAENVRVGCAGNLLEKWGDGLSQFNTTNAAHDLGSLIEQIRKPDEKVYVYSTSYGTFMANRYLELYPDQPDAVVLDSACPATGCDVRMDRNYSAVVRHVFDLCAADEFCASKLGPDPWSRVEALFASVDAGHCNEIYGGNSRYVLGLLMAMTATMPDLVPIAPAVAYRAERCSPNDVAALDNLISALFGGGPGGFDVTAPLPSGEQSAYLGNHIIFSEFWPEGLDRAAAEAEIAALPIDTGALLGRLGEKERWTWPLYTTPDELKHWANTSAPVLLLNGDLDAQTHLDGLADVDQNFTEPWQHFVQLPMASHGTIFWSQPGSQPNVPCGMELIGEFFSDPRGTLDTACAEVAPQIPWAGDASLADTAFGMPDLWENEVPAAATKAMSSPLDARRQRALNELRERIRTGPGF